MSNNLRSILEVMQKILWYNGAIYGSWGQILKSKPTQYFQSLMSNNIEINFGGHAENIM